MKQVQRWPIGNSPLGVLLDPEPRHRAISRRWCRRGDPRIVSVEATIRKHPEYGRITLVFARDAGAPGGLMLQGWVALDSQNNRTTIRLSNQRFNAPVGDGTFRWNDPRRRGPRHNERLIVSFILATGLRVLKAVIADVGPVRDFPPVARISSTSRLRDER